MLMESRLDWFMKPPVSFETNEVVAASDSFRQLHLLGEPLTEPSTAEQHSREFSLDFDKIGKLGAVRGYCCLNLERIFSREVYGRRLGAYQRLS